jgi:hypothetical protein
MAVIRERAIGGRLVRAAASTARASQLDSILDVVARASEPSPAEGMTIRFGWSRLKLLADGDALRVGEPEFARWPDDAWAPTLDITLDTISLQVALLRRVGEAGEDVSLDQVIIAAPGALAQRELFVRRTPSRAPQDSGWLLATLADPEALTRGRDLEAVAIATLVVRRRALLQALTLPTGFTALFTGDRLTEVLDGAGRPRLES